MADEEIETVIVGGGQAGLAMSYHLGQLGREHLVLERQRIAERWRSERWDSLTFQFPNWSMELPGFAYRGADPEGFAPRDEVVGFIEDYAAFMRAPVRCGVSVLSLRQKPGSQRFELATDGGTITAANVVIATGPYQQPAIPPALSAALSEPVQVHSSNYRNPAELPPGAVMVVGSGASGCQIAEDLMAGGRQVYLAVGAHRRVPRRYRGRDFAFWEYASGEFDRPVEKRPAERMSALLTGVDGGHDVDLRALARDGLVLLGRLVSAEAPGQLAFAPGAAAVIRRGDEWYDDFIKSADDYARRNGLDLPGDERSREDRSDARGLADPILKLDMKAVGITSVIWATGFRYDFSWVDLPVFSGTAQSVPQEPVHRRGVTEIPGLYFLGLQWLSKRKSSLMAGVGEDAAYLATCISGSAKVHFLT